MKLPYYFEFVHRTMLMLVKCFVGKISYYRRLVNHLKFDADIDKQTILLSLYRRTDGPEGVEQWTHIELKAVKQVVQTDVENSDEESPAATAEENVRT